MNRFGNWLRRFMTGRYGTDKLNTVILVAGLACSLVGVFVPAAVGRGLSLLSWVLMLLAIFRTFSRNTYKRYQENRRFLMLLDRLKDRDHRYYKCPKCRQNVRVPKGKGKVAITCPRCKERFVKKT